MNATDIAVIVAAAFWGVLVIALCLALFKVLALLDEATKLVHGAADQTVDLLASANETVAGVNVELARVDTIIAGVQSITHTTDQLVGVVHATVSSPLIKVAAYAVGTGRAVKAYRAGA
ncbi:MAG: hypothetical protein ACI9AD_000065 [Nitriliruptoraceae bacterium]